MTNELFSKMTLTKWIALAVVLAVVAFVVLTQFTSFQVPRSLTEPAATPQVGGGITPQGPTQTENNLDAVREIQQQGSGSPSSE